MDIRFNSLMEIERMFDAIAEMPEETRKAFLTKEKEFVEDSWKSLLDLHRMFGWYS